MVTDLSESRARELRAALAAICAEAGLDPAGAQLLRYTNNAVWRLSAPVVVRIGYGPLSVARAHRVVAMTRWLTERAAPVPRLLSTIAQPITIDNEYAATIWDWLPGAETIWNAEDLAAPLRALHALPLDRASERLPRWDPFTAATRRLANADPALDADDRQWLAEQWDHTEQAYRALTLPTSIIHGDAHTGNLLRDNHTTVLCDLDSTGIGPTAWDLVVTAVTSRRFGTDSYPELADAYGRDVTTEPAWPILLRIRELGLVTSVIQDLARRPAVATQHRHRLDDLRTGSTTTWTAYQ